MNRDTRHILCPVDFSELAHRALDHAAAMALWYNAPLTVLHVFVNVPLDLAPAVPHPADPRQREAELQRFVEHVPPEVVLNQVKKAGLRAAGMTMEGDPARQIVRAARSKHHGIQRSI